MSMETVPPADVEANPPECPSAIEAEALPSSVRGLLARTSPAGFLLALAIAIVPLVHTSLVAHQYWAPKAAIGLLLVPAGLVALVRAARTGDRAARFGIVFLVLATVSTLRADKVVLSVFGAPNVGNGLLFFAGLVGTWALVRTAAASTRHAVRTGLVASGVVSCLLAWTGVVGGWPALAEGARAAGFTGNPVHLGAIAASTAIVLAHALVTRRYRNRLVAVGGVVLAAGAVQFSGSRSGVIALVPGLVWLAARYRRQAVSGVVSAVGGLVGANVLSTLLGTSSIARRVGAEGIADSVRPTIWRAAIASVQHHLWWGSGPGRAAPAIARQMSSAICTNYRVDDVHNLGLQLLVNVGVIGTVGALVWVFAAMRRARGELVWAAVALVVVACLQPLSIVTALSLVALLALAAPSVALPTLGRPGTFAIGAATVPAVIAVVVFLIGDAALKQANYAADPVAYATAHRLLPPWPEVSAVGVKANILDSKAKAMASAREAVRRSPGEALGWTRVAALEANAGATADAERDFLHALALDPAQLEAKNSLDSMGGRPASCPLPGR